MQYKNILIKDIDFSCDFFKFLPVNSDRQKNLCTNIKKNGILYPPVLIKSRNSEKFIVVNGFKRLFCALKLEEKSQDCLVMDFDVQSFIKGLHLRSSEKNNENLDESLRFYTESRLYKIILNIKKVFPDFDIDPVFNDFFGKNKLFINKIIRFSDSPYFVQKAFFEGKIALPVLFNVLDYNEYEIKNIISFFNKLSPGLNRQREILVLAEEISHRDDKTISEVLNEDAINQVIENNKISKPQKLSLVINLLNLKRYPEMVNLREKFDLIAFESELNQNPRIIYPKNFEDSNFKIELNFNNIETCTKICKKINKSLEKGYIEKFLNLI